MEVLDDNAVSAKEVKRVILVLRKNLLRSV